jgi:hypothetical protein
MKRHLWIAAVVAACGGTKGASPTSAGKMDSMMMAAGKASADEASTYSALDVGADYATYTKVNKAAFPSETHGGRMVDVYVNPVGLDAYKAAGPMPVGSIVVKVSHQADGDGPLFVMEKRPVGFNPDHGDWYFAIHWADPKGSWKRTLGGPIYWRTPSPRADYCADCHDGYEDRDGMGGVPEAERAW